MNAAYTAGLTPLKESDAIVASRLEEAYANSRQYQWAVELWRNYTQVLERTKKEDIRGNERQVFDIRPVHEGALKRVVWNTAVHMTEKEVRDYFTQIGVGHGDTWRLDNPTGNRHAGAREMLIPWNPAGVVVISYHPRELPDGAMVWIAKDGDTYGLRSLATGVEVYDELDYDIVAPLAVDEFGLDWMDVLPDEMKQDGGVAFVLLGQDPFVDDLDGVDPGNEAVGRHAETPTALANALLDRVAKVRGQVTVVYRVGATDTKGRLVREDSNGKDHVFDSRNIYGAEGWLLSGQKQKVAKHQTGMWSSSTGEFDIEWTILDEVPKARVSFKPYGGMGHVVARYRDEFMDVTDKEHRRRLALWGISYREVSDRVSLRILPKTTGPGYHLRQGGASRSLLVGSDGEPVPWEDWADEFASDLPESIKAALKEVKVKHRTSDEAIKRLMERIKTRMSGANRGASVETAVPDPKGQKGKGPVSDVGFGTRTGANTPGSEAADPSTPSAGMANTSTRGTGHRPVVRRSIQKPPEAIWFKPEEWVVQTEDLFDGTDPSTVFVHLVKNGDEYELWFNEGHGLFIDQRDYYTRWASEKSAAMRRLPVEEIEQAVKQAYELDTIGRVFATMKRLKPSRTMRMFDENQLALTVGAEGYQNVDQSITTDLGGRASALAAGKKAS
jgi:hypothetical protein